MTLAALAAGLLALNAQAQTVETDAPGKWGQSRRHPKPTPTPGPLNDPDGIWTSNADGNWSDTTKWASGTVADGGGKADFSTLDITTNVTVTIDVSARVVREIDIGDTNNSKKYTIKIATGSGLSLIFDNTANNADAVLNQKGGSIGDTISAPILLNSSLDINNASTSTGTLTLSGNISAGSTGTKTITSSTGAVIISGNVSDSVGNGPIAVVQNGPGILTLSGANTFSGGTLINAGIVSAGSSTALAGGPLLFGAGSTGKLQLSGNNITVSDLNTNAIVGSPIVENGAPGVNTLTVKTTNTDTFAGVLQDGASGTLSLTKSGNGSLTLSGLNTYTGGTTLTAGTLNLNSNAALGTGTLTVAGATIGNTSGNAITLVNGNAINITAGTLIFAGPNNLSFGNNAVTMTGGDRVISVSNGASLTIGGIGEDTPPRNFTKSSSGNLILIGASTYTGTTTISGGTLQLGSGGFTGSLSTGSTITDNANLAFSRSNSVVQGTAFTGTAIGGTGSVTQVGTGLLTLNAANTYQGGTTLSAGTLNINNNSAIGTGLLTISAVSTIDNTSGAAITLSTNNTQAWNADFTFGGTNDLNLGTGTVTLDKSHTLTANGGTLTVGGTVDLNSGGNPTSRTLTVTGPGNVSLNGVIQNSAGGSTGSLIYTGTSLGTLTLNGANTYNGTTTLNSGSVILGNKTAFGSGAVSYNGVTISANTDLSGANAIANTGTLKNVNTFGGSNNIELSGVLTNIDSNGGIKNSMSAGLLTLSGTLNLSNNASSRTVIFSGGGNTLVSGVIQDGSTGPENLTKSQGGTLAVTNVDPYTGITTINGGVLDINSNATTTGKLAGTSSITVNSGGTLMLSNTGASASIDRINDSASLTMNGGTFKTGGLSEHGATNNTAGIGALTLQSSSILNLGNGSSVIAFANSNAQTWSGTLSIYNWSGLPTGGGTDQVYFGNDNTGLTATQLSEINFYSDNGMTALGIAQILADGEIVPIAVPEPGTWVASGLVSLALVTAARRRYLRTV